ncbi:MAG: hypothetical protein F4X18_11560 [Acidimicrobiia bacterium]|nr:hypothetical protein [Acidimicrobiia bacterium]
MLLEGSSWAAVASRVGRLSDKAGERRRRRMFSAHDPGPYDRVEVFLADRHQQFPNTGTLR